MGRLLLSTGVSVPHRAHGDPGGVPCLLVHAWCEAARSFDRMLPHLPRWAAVHAVDLRGHGGADKPADGYALADVAADVVAVLDALGLEQAVLVGSSSGGYVAQQVAASWPERVTGLALIGSPATLASRPPFADEVAALTDPLDPAWVRDTLAWFPLGTPVPSGYVDDRVADALAVPASIWSAALEGLCAAEPPLARAPLDIPAVVIWGGRDDVLGRTQRDALAAALPRARIVVLPGVGHLVLWERPERVAAEVARLLAEVASDHALDSGRHE